MYIYLFQSAHTEQIDWRKDYWESFEETPLFAAVFTYICYGLVVLIGHIRDFLNNVGLLKVNTCLEPKIPVSTFVKIHCNT